MSYTRRNVGDSVNGAILLRKITNQRWEMKCKCGNIFVSQPSETSGMCRDCAYKLIADKMRVHGESPDSKKNASRLYGIWLNMRTRCKNQNSESYNLYGGRGITVCAEWDNYLAFKKWAMENGYEDGLSIDRIDVNGNYEPNNCRWATQKEQCRNKRDNHFLTFNGETKTIAEWAEITGFNYHTIKQRINRYGFTDEEALTIIPRHGNNQLLRHGAG